ncbi:MAG: hypothetical protein AAGJ35_09510, partial [Myxococcota bacterium]
AVTQGKFFYTKGAWYTVSCHSQHSCSGGALRCCCSSWRIARRPETAKMSHTGVCKLLDGELQFDFVVIGGGVAGVSCAQEQYTVHLLC